MSVFRKRSPRALFRNTVWEGWSLSFIRHLKEEFQVIRERDPAIKTPLEVLLYPSFRVMIQYRRAHKLYLKGHYFLARWISSGQRERQVLRSTPAPPSGRGCLSTMEAE